MQGKLGTEHGPVASVCPVVAPMERGHVGLWLVGGRSWELLPWEHWMCLQQVCLEEAGLVLTGPWQPHQQPAPHASTALQGTGAPLLPCPPRVASPLHRVQDPSQGMHWDISFLLSAPLCESCAGAGAS